MLDKVCTSFLQLLYKNVNSENVFYYMFVILFSLQFLSENISNQEKFSEIFSQMYVVCYVEFLGVIFWFHHNVIFCLQIFVKLYHIYFFKSSSGSRVVLHGKTGGQADTVRIVVAFRSIANAPKRSKISRYWPNIRVL